MASVRSAAFQQSVARLEHRCREEIARARIEPARADEIDDSAIGAALCANGSPYFKPAFRARAVRAAQLLRATASVRAALDRGETGLALMRAVSVGYLIAEGSAHEQFIELAKFKADQPARGG